jgi:hypothetical protein
MLIHTLCSSLSLLSLLCLHQSLSGNGFQCRRSVNFCVHVLADCHLAHCSSWAELTGFQVPNSSTVSRLTHSPTNSLHSTALPHLNSADMTSERTQQKTPLLCWCGWHGTMCSIAAALSAWCRTAWQHHFSHLSYCSVMSPPTWCVPLLRVQLFLHW